MFDLRSAAFVLLAIAAIDAIIDAIEHYTLVNLWEPLLILGLVLLLVDLAIRVWRNRENWSLRRRRREPEVGGTP